MEHSVNWLARAEVLGAELAAVREAFHRDPELGNHEFHTAERVEKYLNALGIETYRPLETAVVGRLTGALPGPCIGLRADMDALPVTETTGCDFVSHNDGVMHACGHDIHMTAALGAAKLLAAERDRLPGSVRFLFQPDEEGSGGAQRMIDAGCLQDVSTVFGCHVSPELPVGQIGIRYGKFYAASDTFRIVVTGRSAHGAEPEKGIDALAAAAEIVTALRALPKRFPGERCVVTVGTLHAGTAGNILAGTAEMTGILRTLGPDMRREMKRLLQETVDETAASFGARADVYLHESYGGIVNGAGPTAQAERSARALLGDEQVTVLDRPLMTTEDFGCFVDAADGCFYHIGAGCPLPLHNSGFLPDIRAAVNAAAMHAAVIWDTLTENQMKV